MIGDKDPEDAYDATDPIPVRLLVLIRVLLALEDESDVLRRDRRRVDVARLLVNVARDLDDG